MRCKRGLCIWAIRRGKPGACARHRGADVACVRTAIAFDGPSRPLPCHTRAELTASPLLLDRSAGSLRCDEAGRAVRSRDDVDGFRGDTEGPAGAAPDATDNSYDTARLVRSNVSKNTHVEEGLLVCYIPDEKLHERRCALVHGHPQRL